MKSVEPTLVIYKLLTKDFREEPKEEPTTSSDYFGSNNKSKPSRSTPVRPKASATKATTNGSTTTTPTKTNGRASATPASNTRRSSRKTAARKYDESDDDPDRLLKDEDGGTDGVHATDFEKLGRDEDEYTGIDDDEDDFVIKKPSAAKATQSGKKTSAKTKKEDVDMLDVDDGTTSPPTSKAKAARKRKSAELDEDDDGDDGDVGKKKASKKSGPRQSAKKAKPAKEGKEESAEMKAIFDSIPTIRAPTPPPRDENKKFNFGAQNNSKAEPVAAGTKEIPDGAENCLGGLSFVFTGILDTLGREDGTALVKRYGGKVTTAPSKNTSYVVLGKEAGPKKLETIQKLALKTINEDGLFALIRKMPAGGGEGKHADKFADKKAKEEAKIRKDAADLDRQERELAQEKAKITAKQNGTLPSATSASQPSIDARLWTEKYAPTSTATVCGNKGQVEKLQGWLRKWHYNAKFQFKKAGADGTGIYRAAMLHGPPGIGKTTAAHLVANLEGYDVVETNASDTRSKKLVETGLKGVLDTTSLLGYFAGDGKKVESGKKKLCLIMDEVDGMSAGDRGGVGAMAAIAKKTHIPMILICNERRLPKMKPFDHVVADFQFRRPTADQIRARLMTICYREGIRLPPQVIDALIEGSHADIRQIINMISTAKLDKAEMDFDEGKAMSKAWEKHIILKPWDIVSKIVRPELWAQASKSTLNDKIELYFNDHEFSYLMLQENYLKTNPSRAQSYSGRERNYKLLEIYDNAAQSISDGDLVDRMIHGSQQQWSLMPTHAVFSFVRPASFVHGNFSNQPNFPIWLGQNSKLGKYGRHVGRKQTNLAQANSAATSKRFRVICAYVPLAIATKFVSNTFQLSGIGRSNVLWTMEKIALTTSSISWTATS